MRIGVVSDTHGDTFCLSAAIDKAGSVDEWIHLGDFITDAKALIKKTGRKVHAVAGNCDPLSYNIRELIVEAGPARILLTHGHELGVKWGLYALIERARALGCNVALYGHTHMSGMAADGELLIINPGSLSRPRGGQKASFAVLEISEKDINARIINI